MNNNNKINKKLYKKLWEGNTKIPPIDFLI